MHYIAAVAVEEQAPVDFPSSITFTRWQPLGKYPSRRIAEQAARETGDYAFTVFAENSTDPLHRRIIERLKSR